MTRETRNHRYIIVGAGPGGLQAAYFLKRAGRDYVVLEKSDIAGSFFTRFPRHRKLISINKRHNFFPEDEFNQRHDWNSLLSDDPELNFTRYSNDLFPHADDMVRYLGDYAERLDLRIEFGTEVTRVDRDGEGFVVDTAGGPRYRCRVLLMALGAYRPRIPDEIEGIELAESYESHDIDIERFRNKRVCLIGQGNSAFETADHLAGVAAQVHIFAKKPLRFAWDTHYVGDLRAVNNNVIDMFQLKSLHAVLNPRLKKITRLPDGTLQTSHEYDYPDARVPGTLSLTREYDIIIRCTGFAWACPEFFTERARPASKPCGRLPLLTPAWESANVPDLFFVGGAMAANDKQAASGFIHGFRYNVRTLCRMLDERYEGAPYPAEILDPFDWNAFVDGLYERVSVTAALFQLYGFLCDVLVVSPDLQTATVYRELPVAYARGWDFGDAHVLTITLEFGFEKFAEPAVRFMAPSDPTNTACSAFLHPVIRHRRGEDEAEFHFGDSLLARWDRPHASGGAVMSYHHQFMAWANDRLGLGLDLPTPTETGLYRPWSEAEIAAHRAARVAPEPAPCKKPG